MIRDDRLLALIPARGGSKRLPGKNAREVAGRPLIAWTIEAARRSGYVDRVVVSTDDQRIAEVATACGADVPFLRPPALSADASPTIDAVLHAIAELDAAGDRYAFTMVLQPTSPLRSAVHIDAAVDLLIEKGADAVVSVTQVEHPVEWTNVLPADRSLSGFFPQRYRGLRSQDCEVRYRLNGAIYLSRVTRLRAERLLIYDGKSYAYVMDRLSSVDIDTEEDLALAACLLSRTTGRR